MAFIWKILDFFVPKKKNVWAFATHHLRSTKFVENQRAIFEFIKKDSAIKKIIFYRESDSEIDIQDAANYELVKQGTIKAYYLLLSCKVVFVTHSLSMDFSIRFGKRGFVPLKVNLKKRVVVNLWHGISMKRLLYAANDNTRKRTDRSSFRQYERKFYTGLITSSEVDGLVMAAMFYPLNYTQIWTTGLPRNDFLLMDTEKLPLYIRNSVRNLQKIKQAKKLVVYAPTYRQTAISENAYYYQFNENEIQKLKDILEKNNAILGYRPHYFKNDEKYFNLDQYIDDKLIFDCSQNIIPEFSALARECDVLITDYSSVALETLYLDKPNLSFAYDLKNYKTEQDGLIYDLNMIFSGKVFKSFEDLINELDRQLERSEKTEANEITKNLFFNYRDCNNSERVVEKVKRLIN